MAMSHGTNITMTFYYGGGSTLSTTLTVTTIVTLTQPDKLDLSTSLYLNHAGINAQIISNSFSIYRDGIYVASSSSGSFLFTNLQYGTYTLSGSITGKAYGLGGQPTSTVYYSSPLNYVLENPITVPSAPVINSLTPGNKKIDINYTTPSNGGSPITNYQYSINGGNFISFNSTSNPLTISGLTNYSQYTIIIRAVNAIGASSNSNSLSSFPYKIFEELSLDIVPTTNCKAAFSVYRLSNSYTGPTVNVRRSSDNITLDFYSNYYGQLGTELNGNGTTIESWLGTSTGYVTTWYDQSGKGNHATQTNQSQQPKLGNKTIDFRYSRFFDLPNGTVPHNTPYTVTVKHDEIESDTGCWLGTGNAVVNQSNQFRRHFDRYLNYWFGNDFMGNSSTYNRGNTVTFAYDGNHSSLYINGTTQLISPDRSTSGWNGQQTNNKLGKNSFTDEYLNGELFFLYIFDSFLSQTDRRIIESNIGLSSPSNSQSNSISMSNIRSITGKNNMGSLSKFMGLNNNVKLSDIYDFKINNGLIKRIYSGNFNNDVSYFNNNTPISTGVTTNLKNIYCASGGDIDIDGFGPNFLTNNSFQNGNGIPQCNTSENQPTNDIIVLENPGDSPYVLRQTGANTEYQLTIGSEMLPNTTYVMSGWYSKSNDYIGGDTMFHARTHSYSGNHIATEGGLFNIIDSHVIGGLRWYYCYHTITTPSDYSYFNWYVGWGTTNSAGYRYYTKLSIKRVVSQDLYGLFYAPISGSYKFYQTSDSLSYTWLGDSALASSSSISNCLIKNVNKTRYLKFDYGNGSNQGRYLQISGVRVYTSDDGSNIINSSMIVTASSIFHEMFNPQNIVDNIDSTTYISAAEIYPWVKIDLGAEYNIYRVELLNRYDGAKARLAGVRLILSNNSDNIIYTSNNILNKSGVDTYQDGENAYMYYTFFPSINIQVYGNDVIPNTNPEVTSLTLVGGQYYPIRIQYVGVGNFNFSFTTPHGRKTYDTTGYFFSQGINNTSRNLINNSNLVLHYQFNIKDLQSTQLANWASGTRVYDTTLNNGADISTSSYKTGNSSLYLNSSGSQYLLNSATTSTTNGLSFSVWYKSSGSGNWARIFDFGRGQNIDNIGISPNASNVNQLGFFCTPGDNFYLGDINYNDNKWRHIVWTLTYSPEGSSTSIWKIYIDGELKADLTGRVYPSTSVTRNLSYIGKSNWGNDGYYNGWLDDFRMYNRVLNVSESSILYSSDNVYLLKSGNNSITTIPQGLSYFNPATSGYAIYSSNPWLPNGYYWIKSPIMPNVLRMYVDIKNGGFDFYQITGGISVNNPDSSHSGTPLGLDLLVPRSKDNWRAIYNYVYNVLSSTYTSTLTTINVYKTSLGQGGNYSIYAIYDSRFGNNGSYKGAPDWRAKDGGLWYIKDSPFGEPNGDYTYNTFLGAYSIETWPQWLTSYGSPGFNDIVGGYYTGSNYIVSTNYTGSRNFAGSTSSSIYPIIDTYYYDGSEYNRAAPSASYIKNLKGTETNGIYWINLPTIGPTQVYCIMDSKVDGGGWMMTMKCSTNVTEGYGVFHYNSSYWTSENVLNDYDLTRNDGNSKFNTMNYFKAKDILALWPDIPYNYNGGSGGSLSLSTYNNWCWLKNNFDSGTRRTLINLFGNVDNFSLGEPRGVERGTAFSSQAGNAFYGINFTSFVNMKVRWGLTWNNENDWVTNDVIGGIGMYVSWGSLQSLSAGDQIGCCQDQVGINRSARAEIYVR